MDKEGKFWVWIWAVIALGLSLLVLTISWCMISYRQIHIDAGLTLKAIEITETKTIMDWVKEE